MKTIRGLTLEFYRDRKQEFRWRVWSRNGRKMANSGEGYVTKSNVARAAEKVFGHYLYHCFNHIVDNT